MPIFAVRMRNFEGSHPWMRMFQIIKVYELSRAGLAFITILQ